MITFLIFYFALSFICIIFALAICKAGSKADEQMEYLFYKKWSKKDE